MASALSYIAFTNKHTAMLHHVGSLYILTYDTQKLKHKILYILNIKSYNWLSNTACFSHMLKQWKFIIVRIYKSHICNTYKIEMQS